MLKRIEFLPKDFLIKKYSELTGKDKAKVEELVDREGVETLAELLEECLLNKCTVKNI